MGRRVPGLGRPGRLPRDRPGRRAAGGCCACRPRCCAACPTPGSRSAATSSRASTGPRAPSSRPPGSAGALLTLGTLAAGLAHEINNPAAAATRAADALGATCDALLSSLGRLAHDEISAAQFAALDALRLEVDPAPAAVPDPLALADREQELSVWMARRGVAEEWTLAPPLAAAGVDVAWCDRVAAVVDGPAAGAGAASGWRARSRPRRCWARCRSPPGGSPSSSARSAPTPRWTGRRGSGSEVTDGIESTLVMLGHKLRDGVTVVREYGDDVPMIEAYAGELNQVWTNLVDNAVDAMDGHGHAAGQHPARRRLGRRGDRRHRHRDEPQVAARAFEAFYTTKDVDAGTGLGLDIARRIVVERHHGEIAIDSRPGDTVLRVRLPSSSRRTDPPSPTSGGCSDPWVTFRHRCRSTVHRRTPASHRTSTAITRTREHAHAVRRHAGVPAGPVRVEER